MDRRPDRRVQKTKDAIRDAFLELLQTKNYSDITVKELADRANITRKTFYLHYSSLDDMLREVLMEQFGPIGAQFTDFDITAPDFDYLSFFTAVTRVVEHQGIIMRRLAQEPGCRNVIQQIGEMYEQLAMKKYRRLYDLDTNRLQLYITYLVKGLFTMYLQWMLSPNPLSLEEFSAAAADMNRHAAETLQPYRIPE